MHNKKTESLELEVYDLSIAHSDLKNIYLITQKIK